MVHVVESPLRSRVLLAALALAAFALASATACSQGFVSGTQGQPHTDDTGDTGEPVDTGHDSALPAVDCDLAADPPSAWFLEGDLVSFAMRCTGDLATSGAHIVPIELPDGASFDTASLAFTWQTGPADGGRIDLEFAVTARESPNSVPSAETVTFWVADDPESPDNVRVDPATYTEEWGLPVFHIEPLGALGSVYVGARVTYRGTTYPANVKTRGASSSYYPKPSFTLEFNDPELEIPEWDVHRDHLVLVSTFDDNSYVRQKLVYDLWAEMADYWDVDRLTPRTFFAVVYLSGQYYGLYVALDRIDNEFLDQMGFYRDANIYKAVNHDANFYLTNASGYSKSSMHDGYTKEEGDDFDYSDLDALVSFTGNADAESLVAGAGDWIDVEEYMDWFLLVHYSLSEDSAGKNCYLSNDLDDGRFHYVPWDFNHSWGQGWYTYRVSSDSMNYYAWNNRVFWALQSVTSTNDEIWSRFAAMREDGPYAPESLVGMVDDYYDLIEPSAERDWAAWSSSYTSYSGWAAYRSGDWTDYQGEKAYLYQWLDERAALFQEVHP